MEQLLVPDARCPLGARRMIVESAPRRFQGAFGVDAQDDPGDLAPVGAIRFGVKHPDRGDRAGSYELTLRGRKGDFSVNDFMHAEKLSFKRRIGVVWKFVAQTAFKLGCDHEEIVGTLDSQYGSRVARRVWGKSNFRPG